VQRTVPVIHICHEHTETVENALNPAIMRLHYQYRINGLRRRDELPYWRIDHTSKSVAFDARSHVDAIAAKPEA
jgi:hypothetical protein